MKYQPGIVICIVVSVVTARIRVVRLRLRWRCLKEKNDFSYRGRYMFVAFTPHMSFLKILSSKHAIVTWRLDRRFGIS